MTDSFWNGGPDALEKGLREQYDASLRDLRSRLQSCSAEPERAELESEIARTEVEYESKLKEIGKHLF